eukprot:6640453-Prymnesium_polylepis.1
MLKRTPPAVRAFDSPWFSVVWPFAWRRADAASGHIVGMPHSRHVRRQGKPIRLKSNIIRAKFIRGVGLCAPAGEAGPVGAPKAAASGDPTSSRPTPVATFTAVAVRGKLVREAHHPS